MSLRVNELAYEHMNNPQLVQVETEQVTAQHVRQMLYHTSNEDKIPLLLGLMGRMDAHRSIVFVNTKRDSEKVWAYLEGNGHKAAILSGDVPQKKRQSLLKQFQDGELDILVATDVAARGIDVNDLSHVFHYTLPDEKAYYTHRSGRTARAGKAGTSIAFVNGREVYRIKHLEDVLAIADRYCNMGMAQRELTHLVRAIDKAKNAESYTSQSTQERFGLE